MKIFFSVIAVFALSVLMISKVNAQSTSEGMQKISSIDQSMRSDVIKSLISKHGESLRFRIERGVNQAADFWNFKYGTPQDFKEFCLSKFVADSKELDAIFNSISMHFESINGHFNKMTLDLKRPLHLEIGDVNEIDEMFGGYDPSAHIGPDFFENKIAFTIALNFPFYSLKEKQDLSGKWSRKDWAYARVGDMFTSNMPADVSLNLSDILTKADNYISNYNIYMGNLVDKSGKTYFPKDMKLISHWNLRDELKSQYGNQKEGLTKQKMIYDVMKRIVTQEIPESVINNADLQWDPAANKVFQNGKEIQFNSEPSTRYKYLLNNFKALKAADAFNPRYPNYIDAKFDKEMEIPQQQVEKLFIDYVSSPIVKEVASLIKKRLGRDLLPFDIWYDGFKSRSSISQDELNTTTRTKYPDTKAFAADIPNILKKLGFSVDKANYISSKIDVDPSRGAGHAWGADMKGEKAHLRTRIGKDGMDYKGYNIAVHELGHNVEQTLSLYDVDYYMLRGVPNTAFTEAWAFAFQSNDLKLLGINSNDADKKYLDDLDNFWSVYEIMGVSLVDMNVWKWMYANPNASEFELNKAVNKITLDIWNKYYAPVFGIKDQPILGIYSHMIDNPLYLSAYPIGHLIEFQIQRYVIGKNLAQEMTRMCTQGRLIPEVWMQNAVGSGLSAQPMLDAAQEALNAINKKK